MSKHKYVYLRLNETALADFGILPGQRVKVVHEWVEPRQGVLYTVEKPDGVRHNFMASRFQDTDPTTDPTTAVNETTPEGGSLNVPGAKADKGKLRVALVMGGFSSALACVAKVGTDGAAKYTDNGWASVSDGFARYSDAEGRHQFKRLGKGETHDKDSGSLHLAHEAWNSLAKLELYLRDNPDEMVL